MEEKKTRPHEAVNFHFFIWGKCINFSLLYSGEDVPHKYTPTVVSQRIGELLLSKRHIRTEEDLKEEEEEITAEAGVTEFPKFVL